MAGYANHIQGFAGADLSSTGQYLFVYADGTDSEKIKLLTDQDYNAGPVGVLQNAPADDAEAKVAFLGLCTVKAGTALEPYDPIMVGADSKADKWDGTAPCRGFYFPEEEGSTAGTMRDAADGDLVRICLVPGYSPGQITGSATVDFTTILDGNSAVSTITVTGAEVGDAVIIGNDSITSGMLAWGNVTAANVVSITLFNPTSTTVDHASDTWYYTVIKA